MVEEQLARYRSMRDFSVTPEPSGAEKKTAKKSEPIKELGGLPFVIQKHAATRMHYDFRLGWAGVLKSWAVPKGPSYCTSDKRLAAQVEDHPIEYGGFEGVIPENNYGGGTVMLWDTGTWEPQAGHTDVDAGLRDGSLKFVMHGKKMQGKWALVRMGGRRESKEKPSWLLIKEHDEFECKPGDTPIVDKSPNSVLTGRTLDQIAASQDHVWESNRPEKKAESAKAVTTPSPTVKSAKAADKAAAISDTKAGAKPAKASRFQPQLNAYPTETLPQFIPVQLAVQSDQPTESTEWIHELKLDGYRVEARKDGANAQLFTRSGLDWTHRMKPIATEVAALTAESAILDGEVVVLAEDGTTSFAMLQAAFREGEKYPLTYFAFDLLHLNGHNLRDAPLIDRKALLRDLLHAAPESHPNLRFSEHIDGNGGEVFAHACQLHAEGIVSKRKTDRYASGRNASWVKVKCAYDQEFVIGGFTLPSNGSHGIGALLLGYYDEAGKLIYAGRTGTGFNQKSHKSMREALDAIRVKSMPFSSVPSAAKRGVTWVAPTLVAQVQFATWTSDHLVRQASFKGLREDKLAKDVHREDAGVKGSNAVAESDADSADTTKPEKQAASVISAKKAASSKATKAPVEHAQVRLTHPDKILDEESKTTKQQLADYYWAIAEHILPQIAHRPLSLVRCPEGSTKPCFFQKHTSTMLPPGIETVNVPDKKTGKPEPYITLSTREALAGLAQMGVLEVHPWGSKNDDLEHPDRIIIDLDPDAAITWQTLGGAAKETRALLKKLGLESFLKSTGGKGLHVVIPLAPKHDWNVIKQFAHAIALTLEKNNPGLYLTKMSKAARKGRIFIDYLRNERGSTAVAAFSPRARATMAVSMPLHWAELDEPKYPQFHVSDFSSWRPRLGKDPWKQLPALQQKIDIDKSGKVLAG